MTNIDIACAVKLVGTNCVLYPVNSKDLQHIWVRSAIPVCRLGFIPDGQTCGTRVTRSTNYVSVLVMYQGLASRAQRFGKILDFVFSFLFITLHLWVSMRFLFFLKLSSVSITKHKR